MGALKVPKCKAYGMKGYDCEPVIPLPQDINVPIRCRRCEHIMWPNRKELMQRSKLIHSLSRKATRVCRTLHECALCDKKIVQGQEYYDGGYGRRARVLCVTG
jgi:hypothetical protein